MTKAEKDHYDKLSNIGCIVCRIIHNIYSPAEIHHLRHNAGTGKKSAFDKSIPLCALHHRLGGHGVSYHAGRRAFEQSVGYTEVELLELTNQILKGN